jgi:hypothetical protein
LSLRGLLYLFHHIFKVCHSSTPFPTTSHHRTLCPALP